MKTCSVRHFHFARRPNVVRRAVCLLLAIVAPFIALNGVAATEKVSPVDPADLAAKDSATFPGADAEILLSMHTLDESTLEHQSGTDFHFVTEHLVRTKIYTANGVQKQGKVRILYPEGCRINGLVAQVIKPDGKSVPLQKSDIIDEVMTRDEEGNMWKQTSLVFPNLAPGDVIEYQWREKNEWDFWLRAYFVQEYLPTREYRFRVKEMLSDAAVCWQNCTPDSTDNKQGFAVTFKNLPAFEPEVHMPPMRERRAWLFISKTHSSSFKNDAEIWPYLSEMWADEFDQNTKARDAIKQKAAALTQGVEAEVDRLQKIYSFCQTAIINTDYQSSESLRKQADRHKDEEALSPTKVLAAGKGRSDEIDLLFAALAKAAGFEVKLARNPKNTDLVNLKMVRAWSFFLNESVAVRLGGKWTFCSPGCLFLPFGMADMRAENATALVCDKKKVEFAEIPESTAEQNSQHYSAHLTLDADGTLEGDVEETYFGQLAVSQKVDALTEGDEKLNQNFRSAVGKRLQAAEVSNLTWTNLRTTEMPLKTTYHVKVQGYAQRVGERLVLPPSYFRTGESLVFTAEQRRFPIFFPFPWGEKDEVEIRLPEGYVLDNPSLPQPVGDIAGVMGAVYRIRFSPKTGLLTYQRNFSLGANGACRFMAESYPALKELYGRLHESDEHVLMLKPRATPAQGAASAPASAEAAK